MIAIGRIKGIYKYGSTGYWILSGLYRSPIQFAFAFLNSLICTKRLCGHYWPIKVRVAAGQKFDVNCSSSKSVQVSGILSVVPFIGSRLPSSLTLNPESDLVLSGDFEIGPNVHILVGSGASLTIGGCSNGNACGITSDSYILVERSVKIGNDCIIASNVFISDSNWHDINGRERNAPINIGNKVWISHGVSILKGAIIPSGCIVGAKSVISSVIEEENALIVGVPGAVRSVGVKWSK
jgi:acetyltransferase-like isoleucine patch superfamily enzyme